MLQAPSSAWACKLNIKEARECFHIAVVDEHQTLLFPFLDKARRRAGSTQTHTSCLF